MSDNTSKAKYEAVGSGGRAVENGVTQQDIVQKQTTLEKDILIDKKDLDTPEDKLQIIKLGNKHQFQAKVMLDKQDYVTFTCHMLSVDEEIKSTCRARDMVDGGIPIDRYSLGFINTIANLDIATDSIVVNVNGINKEYPNSFWEYIKRSKNLERVLDDIVVPYSQAYVKVKKELQLNLDDLKNF